MLTIRATQMSALGAASVASFARKVAADARVRLPARCAPFDVIALERLVEAAVARASEYGITEVDDIVPFSDLVIAHGLDFAASDELAWTGPLLRDSSVSGAVKLAVLFDRLPARLHPDAAPSAPETP